MKYIITLIVTTILYASIWAQEKQPTHEETISFIHKMLHQVQTHTEVELFYYEVNDSYIKACVYDRTNDKELTKNQYVKLREISSVKKDSMWIYLYGLYPSSCSSESYFNNWRKTSEKIFLIHINRMGTDNINRLYKAFQHLAMLTKKDEEISPF